MPDLLAELGCEVHSIGTEADGRFPRDPEPTAASLTELGELVSGTAITPPRDQQVTFFKSVGLAMQDAFAARLCLQQARKLGIGQHVDW